MSLCRYCQNPNPYFGRATGASKKNIIQKTMIRQQNLMLVDIKKIQFKDKDTGDDLVKWKYTFVAEDDSVVVGYADKERFRDRLVSFGKFELALSKPYNENGSLWENVITWRVVVE